MKIQMIYIRPRYNVKFTRFFASVFIKTGIRDDAFVLGTALQAGISRIRFLMVSMELFIDIILPAATWFWS
jgi:hypothetical protein